MKYHAFLVAGLSAGLLLSSQSHASNPDTGTPGSGGSDFPAVSDFSRSGPFTTTSESAGRDCTVYRPRTLGENGRLHPIIVWGNGTGASPSGYGALLTHWASHGFVVVAANISNAGTGQEMLGCVDYMVNQHNRSTGTFAGKLNINRIGAAGHSQGGGGTIMAGQDRRISVTAPFQPYTLGLGHSSSSQRQQNGPMFLQTGGRDSIASPTLNAAPVYRNANVPVFWGELNSAGHFEPANNGGGYRGPATAWFRYHLMNDSNAQSLFYGTRCGLCSDRAWTVQRKGIN